MEAKHIANIVYIFLMALNGFVLATANVRVTNWQYWVITFVIIGVYICGIFRGVVK